MKKNDILTLRVEGYGTNGEGIAKAGTFPLFIKDAVAGDEIRARVTKVCAHHGFARILEILTPSPDRINSLCPVSVRCGGCTLQAVKYEAELKLKEKKVFDCLRRIGGIPEKTLLAASEPIEGMERPEHYRNKAQYPVGLSGEGKPVIGFYASRSHEIVPCGDCILSPEEFAPICRTVIETMEEFHIAPYDEETHTGFIRHIFLRKGFGTGEIMVCVVSAKENLPCKDVLAERLEQIPGVVSVLLNINPERTNVILGDKTILLCGKERLTDTLSGLSFKISLKAFYQVNPVMTERLYRTVAEYASLTGNEEVWDICCGIGTIALTLAGHARLVHGVEIVPEAVSDARENAKRNGIDNVDFICADITEFVQERGESLHADVVVLDPPRKGLSRTVLDTVIRMSPERIVYVSCDPATLARDLAILISGPYSLTRFRPFDQFSRSAHVETVVLMSKVGVEYA
ncbi:MAG: 23S rRNA (uracil(1939)-C(5))-methyltransferase RlmD [Lachnospiraceae bacterium]|nr:23S rRNA (uracil(1939)-C(5))-methyltransferase RlmD [Lachnospiraceae bacterium]